jgi:hypothetical protein
VGAERPVSGFFAVFDADASFDEPAEQALCMLRSGYPALFDCRTDLFGGGKAVNTREDGIVNRLRIFAAQYINPSTVLEV